MTEAKLAANRRNSFFANVVAMRQLPIVVKPSKSELDSAVCGGAVGAASTAASMEACGCVAIGAVVILNWSIFSCLDD